MKRIKASEVHTFVKENIEKFHDARLNRLQETNLKELLRTKNPYLFKAKALLTAHDLISSLLDARLSSSEEKIFGDFLEELAQFVANRTLGAVKSSSHGIDFQYTENGGTHVLVSFKSGPKWGNSSQWKKLRQDFEMARKILLQSKSVKRVDTILGIGYGNAKTTVKGIITQINGQEFWFKISGDPNFYTDIVEPLGHQATERNAEFNRKKMAIVEKFTQEFTTDFCDEKGNILWGRLVKFNSGNIE